MVDERTSSSAARPRRRRAFRIAALIALGLVALVLLLASEFVAPIFHLGVPVVHPGAIYGPDVRNASFQTDRTVADRWALNVSGGPWSLVGARAVTGTEPRTVPLDESGAFPCPLIPDPYPSLSFLAVPGQALVNGGGTATQWTYDYLAPTGFGLRVSVDAGVASTLGSLIFPDPGCALRGPGGLVVPTELLDSTNAGVAALREGGGSFLSTYPGASISYTLLPRLEPGAAGRTAEQWNVTYDGCGLEERGAPYVAFSESMTVWLDASDGTLQSTRSLADRCPSTGASPIPYSLAEDLRFNDPVRSYRGPDLFYNFSVASACCGLTPQNVSAALHPLNTSPVPSPATLSLSRSGGGTYCSSSADPSGSFTFRCGEPLEAGDLFSLELPAEGPGEFELTLDGLWYFAGEVVLPLEDATTV